MEANYGRSSGAQARAALAADLNVDGPFDPAVKIQATRLWDMQSAEGRRDTLRTLAMDASISVTSALIVSEHAAALPVTDDPFFSKLLGMRTSDARYVGGTSNIAPFLGMEIARTVIPDEVLQTLSIRQILEFREK